MLKENLYDVQKRVEAACQRAGRDAREVTLIAVSKTKPVSMIEEIMDEGVIDFGENKPQELRDKYEVLPKNLKWHMIGHLQRNKVKYIIDKACMIHSVDSLRLAETIQQEAMKLDLIMPVLIEVNIAREDSKFGVSPEETEELVRQAAKLPNLKVEGLMTIAPFVEKAERNRVYFSNLRKLYVDIKSKNIDNVNMCNLSMGMTGDYEIAIEEGATLVRVGTGIFGERNYVK
ncbi:MAG: YggS family pyridoxal phosphate-dependent enzyme [Clostridiales bacterium]|nr:YggS family pyridoxal phosphate-dependent enzyme [Clostridiales bacterium]MDU3239075.1 YggS family pyridoxal phosphate-dependent enzyme [Clostridiales bacterium]